MSRVFLAKVTEAFENKVGLLTCVIVLHLFFLLFTTTPPLIADSQIYHELGKNLSEGTGYQLEGAPMTDFMPAYPLLIAGLYSLFGPEPWVVRIFQVFLFGASTLFLYIVAQRSFGSLVALVAFVSFSLFPAFFIYPATLNAEILVIFLISLLFVLTLRDTPHERWTFIRWSSLSGLVVGLLALAKPEMFLWLPLTALMIICRRQGFGVAVKSGFWAVLAFMLVLSPWIIRNYSVFDKFVPFSTAAGRTFWLSAHQPELTENSAPEFIQATKTCARPNDVLATDQCLSKDAMRMIKEHPMYFAKTVVKRIQRTLIGSHTEYLVGYDTAFSEASAKGLWQVFAVKAILILWDILFVFAGLAGVLYLCRELEWLFLLYLIGTKLLVHGIFFGTARYGLHLSPILAITGAFLLVAVAKRLFPTLESQA
jgi:4-amino-4-deoxy-L-arabinose transferase-like glycosyltransferase